MQPAKRRGLRGVKIAFPGFLEAVERTAQSRGMVTFNAHEELDVSYLRQAATGALLSRYVDQMTKQGEVEDGSTTAPTDEGEERASDHGEGGQEPSEEVGE